MTAVWFTADPHFGHRRVAELRGFVDPDGVPDVGVHDAAIMLEWDRRVLPSDHVWILGDLNLGNPAYALERIAELPGRKHLIAGNHDKCHPMFRDAFKWQPIYLQVFDSVQAMARRRINGVPVLLSHFPYNSDHTAEVRHMQWRLPDHGEWLLHGHTHSAEKRTSEREIHVGVDAWGFAPVNVGEIATLLESQRALDQRVPV